MPVHDVVFRGIEEFVCDDSQAAIQRAKGTAREVNGALELASHLVKHMHGGVDNTHAVGVGGVGGDAAHSGLGLREILPHSGGAGEGASLSALLQTPIGSVVVHGIHVRPKLDDACCSSVKRAQGLASHRIPVDGAAAPLWQPKLAEAREKTGAERMCENAKAVSDGGGVDEGDGWGADAFPTDAAIILGEGAAVVTGGAVGLVAGDALAKDACDGFLARPRGSARGVLTATGVCWGNQHAEI